MNPLIEFVRNKETFFINYDEFVKKEIVNWLMSVPAIITDCKVQRSNGDIVSAKKFVLLEKTGFTILQKKFHFFFFKNDVVYIYE